jgi:exonuclease III
VDQKGNSFWYEDQLIQWEKRGYLDAFRLIHGKNKEYSWYSHQGNGFRYDHAYISPLLSEIIADCRYLHAYREKKISDHSPLVISFNTLK